MSDHNDERTGEAVRSAEGPYGPQTARVRHFLVRFAGLGASAREEATTRYRRVVDSPSFIAAEALLGETIARAGRDDARDALAGPLLQLVRVNEGAAGAGSDSASGERDGLDDLEPVAEPALAALLALLVSDLLSPTDFDTLYAPFASVIPMPAGTAKD